MGMRRSNRRPRFDEVVDEEVVRDAEESLVAALQESDTAVEAFQDTSVDGGSPLADPRWRIGLAGLLLAALGLVVARRRR
jgi:hypothetical protein